MKLGIDIFCSSPASTAVSSGRGERHRLPSLSRSLRHVHENSSSSSGSSGGGGSITPRLIRVLSTPCSSSSDLAVDPKPVDKRDYIQLLKQPKSGRRSVSSKGGYEEVRRRRSSADAGDDKLRSSDSRSSGKDIVLDNNRLLLSDQSSTSGAGTKSGALVPAGASSYGDQHDVKLERRRSSRRPPPLTMVSRSPGDESDYSPKLKPSSYSSSSASSSSSSSKQSTDRHCSTDKVVVLWVSLHCKGCEAKVRKHISKMEGVKSYNTDLAMKRVTIISNMDPNDVLASVSRVKYAQFWPASFSSFSSSTYQYFYPSSSTPS
uniref:HMA domain-containing protein n=1 Tax=Kalanchoe fedtschenkoi TaxID=63787 RepID=A0A7N0UK83_KALFE